MLQWLIKAIIAYLVSLFVNEEKVREKDAAIQKAAELDAAALKEAATKEEREAATKKALDNF